MAKLNMPKLLARLKQAKSLLLSIAAAVLLMAAYNLMSHQAEAEAQSRKSPTALAFEKDAQAWLKHPHEVSEFQADLDAGRLAAVGISTSEDATMVLYTLRDGTKSSAFVPSCSSVSCTGTAIDNLSAKSAAKGFKLASVDVDWHGPNELRLLGIKSSAKSIASLVVMITFFMIGMSLQSMGDRQKTRLAERPDVTFADVVGADEAKAGLKRVAEFLRDPTKYSKLGARSPRGVLMLGPPGTGKTLLAKALAGETKANFIAVDGSYFSAMFFGVGILKVRNLFRYARKHAPCILFIDEIDGLGRRNGDHSASSAEMNRIINRVLVEMDGFSAEEQVIVIGATNHADNIDPALVRAGRFDSRISVELPTVIEREKLFELYTRKVKSSGVDAKALARMTTGMSPADIANTVNKAASSAAEQGTSAVSQEHLFRAVETYQLGGEPSAVGKVLTEATRRRLAVHEAGHALIAHVAGAGTVERVTIEPRGNALGVTYVTRATEEPLYAQQELTARLAMMLGGREAELKVYGDISTGASDDLKRATELAVSMVSTLGFSTSFGLMSVAGVPKELLSEQTQEAILQEARELLGSAQAMCRDFFAAHANHLERLTDMLMALGVVSHEPLEEILADAMIDAERPRPHAVDQPLVAA